MLHGSNMDHGYLRDGAQIYTAVVCTSVLRYYSELLSSS